MVTCGAALSVGLAQPRTGQPPPLRPAGQGDRADAAVALEQMRRLGIAGNYFLEFQLRVMPRRGDERLIDGKLWGARADAGALSRVSLALPADAQGPARERRLLIKNGRESAVWRRDAGESVEMLGVASWFEPLVPGTELAAFDLQMPFIYWEKYSYEGLARFRGRPAHVIVLRPPADFSAKFPAVTGVRVHLDTQFNALMQTEILGAQDRVLKTLTIVDLKKIEEQWIVKTIDVRDEATRNKTRFSVTAAALDVEFSRVLFEPGQLADDVRAPGGDRLIKLGP